jgi:hypothetical protein
MILFLKNAEFGTITRYRLPCQDDNLVRFLTQSSSSLHHLLIAILRNPMPKVQKYQMLALILNPLDFQLFHILPYASGNSGK